MTLIQNLIHRNGFGGLQGTRVHEGLLCQKTRLRLIYCFSILNLLIYWQHSTAHVILYHAPTHVMHSSPRLTAQPDQREGPFHVLMSMEQPKYAVILSQGKYLMDKFDLLMTYSLRDVYPGTE